MISRNRNRGTTIGGTSQLIIFSMASPREVSDGRSKSAGTCVVATQSIDRDNFYTSKLRRLRLLRTHHRHAEAWSRHKSVEISEARQLSAHFRTSGSHAAILAAAASRTTPATGLAVIGIARGLMASGTTRTRSTRRSPFSKFAPFTSTWSAS
jgi:hypothetical protein